MKLIVACFSEMFVGYISNRLYGFTLQKMVGLQPASWSPLYVAFSIRGSILARNGSLFVLTASKRNILFSYK